MDGDLGFFEEYRPNNNKKSNNKMSTLSSDMGPVPDPKIDA